MAFENKTFLAIVPARSGSKGLPGKNIVDLCGKPLMAWSIEAGILSKYIDEVVLSSDSDEFLAIGAKYGAKPLKRPRDLAADHADSSSVVMHVLDTLESFDRHFDYLVLLQPTSPLRNENDIDEAIEMMMNTNAEALISVFEPSHSPYKAFKQNSEGLLEGLIDNEAPFKRRQDLPPVYMPNGAIYIVKYDYFKKTGRFISPKTVPYIMDSQKSHDIDTHEDLKKVALILKDLEYR